MTDTRETLRDAVRAAMKYVVVVLDDGARVMERPHCITQIGRAYDFVWEANQAAETLNIDAAIATIFDRLREPSDDLIRRLNAACDVPDADLAWVFPVIADALIEENIDVR